MSPRRYFRLAGFAITAALLGYAVIDAGLAWAYVYVLTHPGCPEHSTPLAGLPVPEEHWLETSDGLSLRYWYYPSQNGAAIIALGGMGGALGGTLPPVGFLIREGYGVLQVDSRACAQPSAPVTLGAKEALDAEAGLEFLLTRPEVRAIGVFGFSMGGVAAIRLAARHEEINAVVAEGGYFNLGDDFVEPGEHLSLPLRIFLYSIAGAYRVQTGVNPWIVSPIDDLPEISPRPLFLLYGEGEVTSGRAMEQFAAAKDPKALWIIPGGAHGSNYIASSVEYEQKVAEFFQVLIPKILPMQ